MNKQLFVTKSYLPPKEEYLELINQIWNNHILTNEGELFKRFQELLRSYSGSKYISPLVNGSIALQLAIRALELRGEVITTPFSHFASSGSLIWEGCKPVFADIDPETLNIDPLEIEKRITKKTVGILAVHVYGNPCDVEQIALISKKHNIKVIYDAAHAFGSIYKESYVTDYGDISMVSFHATKIIHSIEGAALYTSQKILDEKIKKLSYFGIDKNRQFKSIFGTNAKMNEFAAAMGILSIKHYEFNKSVLKGNFQQYHQLLSASDRISFQKLAGEINYLYVPVIFENKALKKKITQILESNKIFPRGYFYPSLEYIFNNHKQTCLISKSISERILCLPNSVYVNKSDINIVCGLILDNI
jgi:dTDP-4-amino-4,6-dideoxygalactose transaminase